MHSHPMRVLGRRLLVVTILLTLAGLAGCAPASGHQGEFSVRLTQTRYVLGDPAGAEVPGFDDAAWRKAALPLGADDAASLGAREGAIAWFRIRVSLPAVLPDATLALSLGKIADADTVWVNGVRVGSTANPDDPDSHACNRPRLYELPPGLLKAGTDNDIAVRVRTTARADEPAGRGYYGIGVLTALGDARWKAGLVELAFPVVYLVFAFYFLVMFSQRTLQTENLFYGLFALGFAVYSFSRSDIKYAFAANYVALQKLEFLSLYITIPLLMAFFLAYFKERHHLIHYIYYGVAAAFCVAVAVLSDHLHWYWLNVNVAQYTWILPLGTMFWLMAKNFRANLDARIMLASMLVILLTAVHDILLSRGTQLLPFVDSWLTPFAMFLFVASLTAILAIRSATQITTIEGLNRTLEQKVIDRTAALNQSLEEIRRKDEKIEKELFMARQVQDALLPASPHRPDLRLAVRYQPLRQVSGDFYDFLELPDGGQLVVLADVSGHGMPAAIYTILARRAFAAAAARSSSPAAILALANRELCQIDTGQYMTAFLVKHGPDGQVTCANGGHPKALYLSPRQKLMRLVDAPGTVVGARDDDGVSFREQVLDFGPGDRLLLYTDCLVERADAAGEQYGEQRLVASVRKHAAKGLDALLDLVLRDFEEFTAGGENKDDLTVVAVECPARKP